MRSEYLRRLPSPPVSGHMLNGFTLVELATVIAVIVILATIILVSYSGVQNRAYDASVKNDLRVASHAFHSIAVFKNGGSFPSGGTVSTAANTYTELEVSKNAYYVDANTNNFIYCASSDYKNYGIAALSKSGNAFMYTTTGDIQPYTGSWTSLSADVCPTLAGASYTYSWAYGHTAGWKSWATATPGL